MYRGIKDVIQTDVLVGMASWFFGLIGSSASTAVVCSWKTSTTALLHQSPLV